MPSPKEFQEKVDVLDILISILRDHEESLSKIADRFDAVCNDLSTFEEKAAVLDRVLEHLGGQKIRNIIGATGTKGPLVTVNCKSWQSFKGASQGVFARSLRGDWRTSILLLCFGPVHVHFFCRAQRNDDACE